VKEPHDALCFINVRLTGDPTVLRTTDAMRRHSRFRTRALVAILVASFSGAIAWPCLCTEFPTFDEALKRSPVALVVRVDAQGRLIRERLHPELDVAYLDVTVVAVLKGEEPRQHVRIWDPWFGSSCSSDWRPLVQGTLLAFAVLPTSSQEGEFWDAMELSALRSSTHCSAGILPRRARSARAKKEGGDRNAP
jgi:hypothetical protein